MTLPSLTISAQTQRRFILGKQGLWPGRRWQGKAGAAQAMREGVVVQMDPLNMIARSHDITLHSRVIDYSPALLMDLMYQDRAFFDYGGVVQVHPMEDLPYWRVVMARAAEKHTFLAERNQEALAEVQAALRERGPLGNRDFSAPPGKGYWHAGKTTAQALYYLWIKGEVMTHSRRRFERLFDLAERIVPAGCDRQASADEAEAYFAQRVLQEWGLTDLRGWRSAFMGTIDRKVSMPEAADRLEAMVSAGLAARVTLEDGLDGKVKDPARYLLAADLPLLEELHAGRIPAAWQPTGPTTTAEVTFFAPLDIVSARGRALPVFDFEYKWEVYTPVSQRRWGYYVLPVLYGDRLVGRFDSKLDRSSRTLIVLNFILEEGVRLDEPLEQALSAAFQRFARFAGADQIDYPSGWIRA